MFNLFGSSKSRALVSEAPQATDKTGDVSGTSAVVPPGLSAAEARRAADEARDVRHWSEAAKNYLAFLEHYPDDIGIRIQAGNTLKEDGRFSESLDCYKYALKLDPQNADGILQMAHVLKLMGRKGEAARAYRTSLDFQPCNNPAFHELLALESIPGSVVNGSTATATTACIFIDVSDLIAYLRDNVSLSGIQRVVSNLVMHASDFNAKAGETVVRFVRPEYDNCVIFELDSSLLAGTINAVAVGKADRGSLDRALNAIGDSRQVITLKPSDTLVIAGAFWIYPKYDLLNTLRQNGTIVTVFIHDLIQVSHPQFVAPVATAVFRKSFVDVLCVANYVLTNSEFVAKDVRRFLTDRMNFQLPVTAVTLATELGFVDTHENVSSEYEILAKEDYVLCVATIEIRKNHMYLIKLWERLDREFNGDIPNLVFVGKWGWKIEELQEHLEGSDYLGGRLHIFNGISDRDLAFLYENCLFTMYASFAEGWGLPVGESLGYGKPCLASNATSIPEVGGKLCKYFDPLDMDDGYELLSGLLADRSALAAWTSRIRSEFRPKTWSDFSAELLRTVERRRRQSDLTSRTNNCVLEMGQIATIGNDPLVQLDKGKRKLVTARMSRMSGWHDIEAWGCWASKRRAVLKFSTRLPAGTDVSIYLYLKTPDGDEGADCTIVVNETKSYVDDLGSVPCWFTAAGRVGQDGVIDITFISGKGFFHRYGRELYLGLIGIAVVPEGDTAKRVQLLDQIIRKGETRPSHGGYVDFRQMSDTQPLVIAPRALAS